jgi:hypothetical protein
LSAKKPRGQAPDLWADVDAINPHVIHTFVRGDADALARLEAMLCPRTSRPPM